MKQSKLFNFEFWILNFWKNVCDSSNFRKIWAIVPKLHTNIIHRSRTFGIELGQNRLQRSNFLRFWFFWKFALYRVSCANFEFSSSNFVRECTNTELCFIRNLMRISQGLKILDKFEFFNFFYRHRILKIRYTYLQSFLCEEVKIKQYTFSKKELC